MIEAYPLHWPANRPRTPHWERERSRFDTTFTRARDTVVREITLLCGGRYARDPQIVISTNLALRRDGMPLASQKRVDDSGVAVYFLYKKRQMSFSCDRWERIEENMQAIAKTIEALRGVARWGTGDMMEAAFSGFAALPSSAGARHWSEVLGVPTNAGREQIEQAYRVLAMRNHPDRGGDPAVMAEINQARDVALRNLVGA